MQTATSDLKGYQRKYLRALAHRIKPLVLIGQKGLTDLVTAACEDALDRHELIKIKFIEGKGKSDKKLVLEGLQTTTGAHFVGMIGHTVIFFRQNSDPAKQKIALPLRPSNADEDDAV
ncbi:MAG: hypothetical protein VR64_08175 [Desulfatitalea sp. BRH_c12]|nr:MAG: hypothetical protein VR64_08175 [Desulfatitalea sp. BRH_c12]